LAGLYSKNLYSLSQFGDVRRGEDIENFVSLYLMTMIAYGLVTYPRLKKLKDEYKFSKLGKATSFILHEISKPIFSMELENESDKIKIEELKSKLEIARQLQEGLISNKQEPVRLDKIIEDVLEENRKFINFFPLNLELNIDEVNWIGDSKLVKTIISNLIRNSIEAITTVQVEPFIRINLKNNKLIIVNNFQTSLNENELFQPMKSSKIGNMGMGLYISKSLAESQNLVLMIKIIDNNFVAELSTN
jgi:signal transduction histidine kinase